MDRSGIWALSGRHSAFSTPTSQESKCKPFNYTSIQKLMVLLGSPNEGLAHWSRAIPFRVHSPWGSWILPVQHLLPVLPRIPIDTILQMHRMRWNGSCLSRLYSILSQSEWVTLDWGLKYFSASSLLLNALVDNRNGIPWISFSNESPSNLWVTGFSSVILWVNHAWWKHRLMAMLSLLFILMAFTRFLSTSADALLRSLILYSCYDLAGIRPQLNSLALPRLCKFSNFIKSYPLSPSPQPSNFIIHSVVWRTTQVLTRYQ